jgi:hypothetical protein
LRLRAGGELNVAALEPDQESVYRCYLRAFSAAALGQAFEMTSISLDEDLAAAIGASDGQRGNSPRWSGALLATVRHMKDPALGAGGGTSG